jgi:hypothetical protein
LSCAASTRRSRSSTPGRSTRRARDVWGGRRDGPERRDGAGDVSDPGTLPPGTGSPGGR